MDEVLFKKRKQYGCAKAGCNIEHFHWALAAMPKVAPTQWRNSAEGFPTLTSHGGVNSITGAAIYFSLTVDELFHLLVPGYQDKIYGGRPLGENANPDDLIHNIYEFVSMKEMEANNECIPVKEKNKIKKYKYQKAA